VLYISPDCLETELRSFPLWKAQFGFGCFCEKLVFCVGSFLKTAKWQFFANLVTNWTVLSNYTLTTTVSGICTIFENIAQNIGKWMLKLPSVVCRQTSILWVLHLPYLVYYSTDCILAERRPVEILGTSVPT